MSGLPADASFNFLSQGAIIQEFRVAGHQIVQSFPDPALYADNNISTVYFGETIGRTSNRIKNGIINNLNGKSYRLALNNGPNSLHGGKEGWGRKTFMGPKPVSRNGREGVELTYVSPDGEENYPGTVELRVWYTAWKEKEDGIEKVLLEAEYEVEMIGDECEETAVGVTNHSYFNLSAAATIEGTIATLCTEKYLPLDDTGIPLGHISNFPGIKAETPFVLGAAEPDIDDCFIVNDDPGSISLDSRSQALKQIATLAHPATGLHLEVLTTEPAFQFYTGKYIHVPEVGDSPARGPRSGICIEPQRYVNSVNVPAWRNMVLLKQGQKWGARNVYRAWKS